MSNEASPSSLQIPSASQEAWDELRSGNERYRRGATNLNHQIIEERRLQTAAGGAKPFAAILACSDSRVPAEIVFDQGLGDLFMVRVAGNTLAPSLIGSLELSVLNFGIPLIVVLGHERCGAVQAACRLILENEPAPSPHLEILLEEIQPSVIRELNKKGEDFSGRAVDAELLSGVSHENVRHGIEGLLLRSEILREYVQAGKLWIVGGVYDLDSGEVHWEDGSLPDSVEL